MNFCPKCGHRLVPKDDAGFATMEQRLREAEQLLLEAGELLAEADRRAEDAEARVAELECRPVAAAVR